MSTFFEKLYTIGDMLLNNISTMIGYRKLSVAETARLAGLKYSTVDDLYYGRSKGLRFETLNKLCWALDCTPNDLLRYIPDENPPV